MSNPIALKVTAGVLAVGGVSGGGYLIHSHISNKTLNKNILSKNKKISLTKGDKRWDAAFKKYQFKSSKDDQYKVEPTFSTHGELENWCLEKLDSPHEEGVYAKIEKLCTTFSISEYLETKSKTLLTSFTEKANTHKTYSTDANLIIPQSEIGVEKASITEEKLKNWFTSAVSSEFKDENDILYKRINQWCLNG